MGAVNRLNRDEILLRALDLADSSVMDQKDRPAGVIVPTAFTIPWLQEAVDYFHQRFPFSANIKDIAVTIAANSNTLDLSVIASDFILDYKDGLILDEDEGRLRRRALSWILNQVVGQNASPLRDRPRIYAIRGTTLQFYPSADKQYQARLYYYGIQPLLGDTTVPLFPSDHVLTQYVWLKIQEWHRAAPAGTALKFANEIIADFISQGIGAEAEEDEIQLDPRHFGEQFRDHHFGWMGKTSL